MSKGNLWPGAAVLLWLPVCPTCVAQPFSWGALNSPTNNSLTAVVNGANRWVAVGRNSTILESSDGWLWKQAGFKPGGDLLAVAYGNGVFVAGGSLTNQLCISVDGTHWSSQPRVGAGGTIEGLTFGGGRFVGVGNLSGAGYVITSTDGTNWTSPLLPATGALRAVAYSDYWVPPNWFVAVGDQGALLTSSNGLNWTVRASSTPRTLRAITAQRTSAGFLAAGDYGAAVTSQDGISWSGAAPLSFEVKALAKGNGGIVAVGHYQSEGRLQTTSDGKSWPGDAQAWPRPLNGIASDYSIFMTVGDGGLILTSSTGPGPYANSWTNPASGMWEQPYWSVGELPAFWNVQVLFTNAGSKTLTIGPATAANYPSSLRVRDLLIDAPTGSENRLLLNHAGLSTPLSVLNTILVSTNGSLDSVDSAVTASKLDVRNRAVFAGSGSSQFGNVSLLGPVRGAVVLSNGWFSTPEMAIGRFGLVGVPGAGSFTQYGGSNVVGVLAMTDGATYELAGGILSTSQGPGGIGMTSFQGPVPARILVSDGVLISKTINMDIGYGAGAAPVPEVTQSGGSVGSDSVAIAAGLFSQTAGLSAIGTLDLYGARAGYHLTGGELLSTNVYLSAGRISQAGGTHTNSHEIALIGTYGASQTVYQFDGGALDSPSLSVQGSSFSQATGTTNHTRFLRVWSGGQFTLSGGTLSTFITVAGDPDYPNAVILVRGGVHAAGTLNLMPGGRYELTETGLLSAPSVNLSAGELRLTAGSFLDNQSIVFAGGSLQVQGTRAAGQLVLAGPGQIVFAGNTPATIRFQDSHAAGWTAGASLAIWNWSGTNGGGTNRIYVGTDQQGLTASQVRQVFFYYAASPTPRALPARLLPTGELVPEFATALSFTRSGGQLVLSWAPGYDLYTSTNLAGVYEFVTSVSPHTNGFESPQQFFLLRPGQ